MMRILFLCVTLLVSTGAQVQAQPQPEPFGCDIRYYLPAGNYRFNPQIPQPRDLLGFEVGEQHADWTQVLTYMQTLADTSDRVSVQRFGQTYEHRPFIQVAITSARNQQQLEEIRRQHLALSADTAHLPLVVNLLYSIHGNEPSGVNSSLALAYYLAASEDADVAAMLERMVVILTPGENPDGINRFASWVNTTRTVPDVADLQSREFTEPWPSSRSNHYWADTNRDWLMAEHPEGRNALEMYFRWMPHVVCDFHEQGGDRCFYMSPGDPRRTNPLTPPRNQELTAALTAYSARELDKIGTLYFARESYDDYYIGKGAAYGDIHGSVGILFEQLASRGYLRPTKNYGVMSFASTIRNQNLAAIGVLKGALQLKNSLQTYRHNYLQEAARAAARDAVKGYLVDARGARAVMYHFLRTLQRHRIDVYRLAKSQTVGDRQYDAHDAYVIPTNQENYAMIKTLMDNVTHFTDSTFYDISTWTFPHAYNLRCDVLRSVAGLTGERVTDPRFEAGSVVGDATTVGYLFDNSQYYTPKVVFELLRRGCIVKVSSRPFTYQGRRMGYGAFIVPVQNQPLPAAELSSLIARLSRECGVTTYAAPSASMSDHDLGARSTIPITLPRVAIVTGRGMGVTETGEAWMMLAHRFQQSPTLIDYSTLGSADLSRYNVLIMAGGIPSAPLSERATDNVKRWAEAGGTLIAIGTAYRWTNRVGLTSVKVMQWEEVERDPNTGFALNTKLMNLLPEGEKKTATGKAAADKASTVPSYLPYASRKDATGNNIDGAILQCRLDRTHPIGWGYEQDFLPVMRNGATVFAAPDDPYSVPLSYAAADRIHLSGFISRRNIDRLADSPAVVVQRCGKGRVILFVDDPNFRMYWYGGTKLFMNAILFGQLL